MSSNRLVSPIFASSAIETSEQESASLMALRFNGEPGDPVSAWSSSKFKQLFDIFCVVLSSPLILPLCICIAFAVRLTSRGPALFKQSRSGLHGAKFTIFKFRTMEHEVAHKAEANLNRGFTSIGPFLRRWKLDELPQLLNVLLGDMSLVGPRPKLAEHQLGTLRCRPGITGAATLIFANEEAVLKRVPEEELPEFFRTTVLPAKLRLDREYMGQATWVSDLDLVFRTLARRWDRDEISRLLGLPYAPSETLPSTVCRIDFESAMEESSAGD